MRLPLFMRPFRVNVLISRLSDWRDRSGTAWKTAALVVAFCVVNALRRNVNSRLLWDEPDEWLIDVANSFLTGLFVAGPVVFAVIAALSRVPVRGVRRAAAMIAVVALSSAVGTCALAWWEVYVVGMSDVPLLQTFSGSWPRYLVLSLLFAWAYTYHRDRQEAREAMRQSDVARAEFERRIVETRLMVLQAQIEPHFLFNTLAHVKRLYQTDLASARTMLENLRQYLAVALPQMREPIARLDREIALAESYLNLQQTRMGRRLAFAVDLPPALAAAKIPTMLVLTLVENAIKHGLNPLREGGSVLITARTDDGQLSVEVADSGRGFVASSGGGAGLANLRARLAILYGSSAALTLRRNKPRGVSAVLTLPRVEDPGAVPAAA